MFDDGSGNLIPHKWREFFALPNAKVFPGPHRYGSPQWSEVDAQGVNHSPIILATPMWLSGTQAGSSKFCGLQFSTGGVVADGTSPGKLVPMVFTTGGVVADGAGEEKFFPMFLASGGVVADGTAEVLVPAVEAKVQFQETLFAPFTSVNLPIAFPHWNSGFIIGPDFVEVVSPGKYQLTYRFRCDYLAGPMEPPPAARMAAGILISGSPVQEGQCYQEMDSIPVPADSFSLFCVTELQLAAGNQVSLFVTNGFTLQTWTTPFCSLTLRKMS